MTRINPPEQSKQAIAFLKKGTAEIARKDAEFLQKRLDSLQYEMSVMTGLLGTTAPDNQGPLLRGLEQLGDRLKSAGRAVAGFYSGGKAESSADLSGLQKTLQRNYLDLTKAYTSLAGGDGKGVETRPAPRMIDKTA